MPSLPGGHGEALTLGNLLYICASMLGGWLGWALGAHFGMMVAFLLSVVGTAVGVYAARRITRTFL